MIDYTLEIKLLSDTVFGMGAGVSGLVDTEIQHDEKGLPVLSGRAIKGLLVNECSEILYVLPASKQTTWKQAALNLFGQRGEMLDDISGVFIAAATAAPDLVAAIHADQHLTQQDVINSLTTIRRQTAINIDGAPDDETLRAVRVLVRGLTLYAVLSFPAKPTEYEKALLAACVMSLRRAGLNRTRGKGKLEVKITERSLDPVKFAQSTEVFKDQAPAWFVKFKNDMTTKSEVTA